MIQILKVDFSWHEEDLEILLPILLTIITFIIYWFTAKSEKVKKAFYRNPNPDNASINHITFNRLFGFLIMGVVPAVICLLFMPKYLLSDYGLTFIRETSLLSLLCILGLAVIVIPTAYTSAKKPKNLVNYPQIRAKTWTNRIIIINALGWALYLLGYEFLFRGILLFPLVANLGVWNAIAINIALYSATHIPKGLDETIGAIPLGSVLCILTLISGTIWIAFLVHLAMAWTNSFTALKFHPDMHYKKTIT
jgi:membrane protease YdiL (CAAX protease family)